MPETLELPLTVQKDVTSLDERVGALVVTNQDQYDGAAELLSANNKLKKAVKETFAALKKAAKAAHTAVCDAEKKHLAPCEDRELKIKDPMKKWFRVEEARVAKEEEEARAKIAKQEEEDRLAKASKAEAKGDTEGADAALTEPRVSAPPPVLQRPQKAKGAVITKRLAYRVVDGTALMKASLDPESPVPMNIWGVDKGAMQRHLSANGKELGTWPGIEVYEATGVSAR